MTATAQRNGRSRSRVQATEEHAPTMAEALLAVQSEAPKLARNAEADVKTTNYRYSYKYVTLDALLDAVLPLLVAHELVWSTMPTSQDGAPALRYRLTHIPTGDWIEDVMPLMCAKPDPQGQGSAITYARRYALTAVLNLAPDDDDDGAAASAVPVSAPQAREQNRNTPTAAPAKQSDRPATAPQRKMLRAKAGAAKLTSGAFANVIKVAADDEAVIWSDEAAAERWLDRALDRLPARLVDAVIAGIAHAGAEGSQA